MVGAYLDFGNLGLSIARRTSENPQYNFNKPGRAFVGVITEQVGMLNRGESAAGTDIAIRDVTCIKPDRDKPWIIRTALSQLFDC